MSKSELKRQCCNLNIGFLDNSNILKDRDLDRGGLHLNDDGIDKLFYNILDTIRL